MSFKIIFKDLFYVCVSVHTHGGQKQADPFELEEQDRHWWQVWLVT